MTFLKRGLAPIVVLGLSTAALASGTAVYEQEFDPLPPLDLEGAFSDGVPGQYYNLQVADDFEIGTSTTVNGVHWTGFSENFTAPDLSNFDSFAVRIYADDGAGSPGDLMLEEFPLLDEIDLKLIAEGGSVTNSDIYEFWWKFEPIMLAPGTYWLSVGSINVDAAGDSFVWAAGLGGNGLTLLDLGWDGSWEPATFGGAPAEIDMAFTIQGPSTDCPEDLDEDGTVGFTDLAILLGNWGTPGADLDGDGSTGFNDLAMLLGRWGPC